MQGEHRWRKWVIYVALAVFGAALLAVTVIPTAGSSSSHASATSVAATSCEPQPAALHAGDSEHTRAFSSAASAGPCARGAATGARRLDARRAWLASESAHRQRLASRAAFRGLSSLASARLLHADFGSRIGGANPARTVARAGKLIRYLGDNRAVVRTPAGRTKVITSSVPLRGARHGGPKRPIDLALHAARGSFAPANPLVSTSIARRLGDGATVGSPQIKVIPLGHDVEGTSSAGSAVSFHGIGTDEDATVTPTLTGVELSTQLRSPQSSERIAYRLVLPAGARLVAHGARALIERTGRALATVSAPSAIDAQGTPVPVRMSVRGAQLMLEVDHRSREVAYPVLVDPRVEFQVKKSSPGWSFWSCESECGGEGYSGQEIEGPEPGVLTAPAGYYGYGILSKESEGASEFCDEVFEKVPGAAECDLDPFEYIEPEVSPSAAWEWPDENAAGESRVVKTKYEGVAMTPGAWVENSRGIVGTGSMGYEVGCYFSNNLSEETPPATIEGCSGFPRISLGFLQMPYEQVWTGPPVSAGWPPSAGKFGYRLGQVTDGTTLSIEAAVVEEERKPHRRHGPRKRELLGPNSPGDPKLPRSCSGDPVDCATGNLTETQTDIDVPGLGVGLTLARTYNSQAAAEEDWHGPFGYGWSWSFGAHLITNNDYSSGRLSVIRTVEQGNGSTVAFVEGTPRPGVQATLRPKVGSGSYLYTLPDQTVMTFDSVGKLASETDRNGNVTKVGEVCEGGEEGGGGVASVRMRYASYTTMDVSGEGEGERTCRIEVTDASSRTMTLYLNAEGFVERATDPMGHTVYYEYEDGELTSVTYPGESMPRWRFKYDSHHRLTQITDGRGHHTTNEYDSSNRVTAQTDPRGDTRHFEYEHAGEGLIEGVAVAAETEAEEHLPEITEEEESLVAGYGGVIAPPPPEDLTTITDDASEAVTFERFDSEDALVSQTLAYATPDAATSEFTYDKAHDLTSTTDGNGHTTKYTYDSAGNRTSRIDADGNKTKWEYDSEHDVIATTSPNGEDTTIERDSHGNALKVSRPAPSASQVTEYAYNGYGELTSMTDPLEHVWKYEYDGNGDRIVELSPEGDKRTFDFNADSQEISTTSPRGNAPGADPGAFTTTIERDEHGRVLRVTEPVE